LSDLDLNVADDINCYVTEIKWPDVRNSSMSLSPTLIKNEKVEYYIRIKIHKFIVLRFWVKSGTNVLCSWTQISLVFVLFSDTSP